MQDIIRFKIVELVKEININQSQYFCEQTEDTLYHIYKDLLTSEEIEEVSVLYRLIFHAFKQNPLIAYELLSGFLQFGQSAEGLKYKPLLDHLAIEAFDKLLEIGGWAILKECLNNFRDNLENLQNEPIFKHIISRIVKQLYADENEEESPDNLSDICHHLPREKSFTWGWFSYYIAEAYYIADPYHIVDDANFLSKKKMRNYLMIYRKLITNLRKFVPIDEPATITDYFPIENKLKESWEGILEGLSLPDYKWASDLINCTMADTYYHHNIDISQNITEAELSFAIASEDVLIEQFNAQAPVAQAPAAQAPAAQAEAAQAPVAEEFTIVETPPTTEKNINTSWFGWLGWS